ncbi:amino acid adenylation domain-containing protein [Roseivirga sp. BDSF3-8]|uniref:amino acid adenylation domain-containing protein n=1 Tax=Roseivirga sp. BDSF3-8 TaxID=3241598 RepID=UPI0035321EF9
MKELSRDNIQDIYELAPAQEGMYVHHTTGGGAGDYFRQIRYRVHGDLDAALVRQSLAVVVGRHDVLRTVFNSKKTDRNLQVVLKKREAVFHYEDISHMTADSQVSYLNRKSEEQLSRGYDLGRDMLLQVSLYKVGETTYEFFWNYHHIILDGWSTAVLSEEFWFTYQNLKAGREASLPAAVPFRQYILWLLRTRDHPKARQWWSDYLSGYQLTPVLPVKHTTSRKAEEYIKLPVTFSAALTAQLEQVAKEHHVTTGLLLQAIWAVLVAKYNGTSTALFGLVVSGRPTALQGMDRAVGNYINVVPVRISVEASLQDILSRLKQEFIQRQEVEYLPLNEISGKQPSQEPLFDHVLAFDNFPIQNQSRPVEDGLQFENYSFYGRTNFDLNVNIRMGEQIRLSLDFKSGVFEKDMVTLAGKHLLHIAQQLAEGVTPAGIRLTDAEEEARVLALGAPPAFALPECTVLDTFTGQARRNTTKAAITDASGTLTYAGLNSESDLLASELIARGISHGDRVGVHIDRGVRVATCLLAIWKAGAVYVPLDMSLPTERVAYIIDDAGIKLILTGPEENQAGFTCKTLSLPMEYGTPDQPLPAPTALYDTAYIIYTSGTTGMPKGVPIRHESIADRIGYHNAYLPVLHDSKVLQFASLSFDASLVEILMPLCSGGTSVVAGSEVKANLHLLTNFISIHQVSHVILPPAILRALERDPLKSVTTIISTGEAAALEESLYYARHKKFVNGYGPTETCVGGAFYEVKPNPAHASAQSRSIPIGRPFANTRIYILDKEGSLAPEGHPGEIVISGIGLSSGYLNRPDLTGQKFTGNPFTQEETYEQLYHTGDLGRWNEAGELEYLGRIDDQVQVRGIRVEMSEIAHALQSIQGIKDVAIIPHQSGSDTLLMACYSGLPQDSHDLRKHLVTVLPAYMVPSRFIYLPELPLTPNGKVDKKAILQHLPQEKSSEGKLCQTETERLFAGLWQDILGADNVSASADFFELGGHSLKATVFISRVYKETGIRLNLEDIFLFPVLEELARHHDTIERDATPVITPAPQCDDYPLTSSQYRIWLACQFSANPVSYNVVTAYTLEGRFDINALRQAFEALLQRHESLRTRFITIAGEPRQCVRPDAEPEWLVKDISAHPEAAGLTDREVRQMQEKPFDLREGNLLRVTVLKHAANRHVVIFATHHIVCDAWSVKVMTRELFRDYNALAEGKAPEPVQLPVQQKDFAVWQQQNGLSDKDRNYWHKTLNGISRLQLPLDYPRPEVRKGLGDSYQRTLPKSMADSLTGLAVERKMSRFIVLLASVKALLFRLSGQADIAVGTTINGRDLPELQDQIGFYLNTLVLRTQVHEDETFLTLLNKAAGTATSAYRHQDYPFDKLVEELEAGNQRNQGAFFDVLVELIDLKSVSQTSGRLNGLSLTEWPWQKNHSKHSLAFRFIEKEDGLDLSLEYDTELFSADTVSGLQDMYHSLLQELTSDPASPIINPSPEVVTSRSSDSSLDFNF